MSMVAILLIIGSAVVGPIEAQQIATQEQVAESVRLFNESLTTSPIIGDVTAGDGRRRAFDVKVGIRTESLPELCERAMREIGAQPSSIAQEIDGDLKPIGALGHFMYPYKKVTEPYHIRGIPVPTGYKR